MHEAVKWGLTRQEPVTIHFDSKAAGEAAANRSEPPSSILPLTRATQGLVSVAAERGQPFQANRTSATIQAPD